MLFPTQRGEGAVGIGTRGQAPTQVAPRKRRVQHLAIVSIECFIQRILGYLHCLLPEEFEAAERVGNTG
jgi:hypothetical protein